VRAVRQWIDENKRAPKPDWAVLDECFNFEPHELEHDEAEDTFDFAFQGLELTEHQKLMLLPPDKRIKQLVYPEAVKNRVNLVKSRQRKNQWGAKFGKFFAGRAALRWQEKASKHGRAKLEQEHAPKAKVSTKNVDKKLASIRKGKGKSAESGPTGDKGVIETADKIVAENAAKSKYDSNKRIRDKQEAREEEGPEHEWLKKNVRVVAECEDEGRAGLVTNVYRYNKGERTSTSSVTSSPSAVSSAPASSTSRKTSSASPSPSTSSWTIGGSRLLNEQPFYTHWRGRTRTSR